MEYISVKDFATQSGRSLQSVYQQMKRETTAELLEGHIIVKTINNRKIKYLDEYAVEILSRNRNSSPVVIALTDDRERIEMLEQENKALLLKLAEQSDKLIAQIEENAKLKITLIESNARKLKELEEFKISQLDLENQIEKLKGQLNTERQRKLTVKERLIGKKSL